jgi:hypothetical protein
LRCFLSEELDLLLAVSSLVVRGAFIDVLLSRWRRREFSSLPLLRIPPIKAKVTKKARPRSLLQQK